MDGKDLSWMANEIKQRMISNEVTEEVISEIEKVPELVQVILPSGSNLFLDAVLFDKLQVVKALVEMGADVHCKNEASAVSGNALNVAGTPKMADYLLEIGVEVEKNLQLSMPYWNPVIKAVHRNNEVMFQYWIKKEKELFKEDEKYIEELVYVAIEQVCTMNQYPMLSSVMKDDELYDIMKRIYSELDNLLSIKLYLGTLRRVTDETLEDRKKELRKILNGRKKELDI